jgi:hypothetical protein
MTPVSSTHAPQGPWYRDRWPWLLILGPAIVVVAGIATLVIAVRTDDGLVADDYYKRGLAINQLLERGARAAEIGVAATVDVGGDGRVVVTLDGGGSAADARPATLKLRLAHPTRAGEDRAASLARADASRYEGQVPPVAAGRWLVIVESDTWRLPGVEVTAPIDRVKLEARR